MKVVILISILTALLLGCSAENTEKPRYLNGHIRSYCIEGHVYYMYMYFYQAGLTPKLDDDGKPCKCD